MKTRIVLFAAVQLFLSQVGIGQNLTDTPIPVTVLTQEDIFKQGVWNFSLNQYLDFNAGTNKDNGEKTGKYNSFDTRMEANYFFIDHFALGVGVRMGSEKTTTTVLDPETIERTNVIGGYLNAIYGTNVGGVINLITKANVGGGQIRYRDDYGYGELDEKDKYFTAGVMVGTPFMINRNVYFTPSLGYEFRQTKWDDNKEVRNSFNVGLRMDFFMGCGDDHCELSKDPLTLDGRYDQGNMELGSRMFGSFQTGNQKTTYQGEGEVTQKDGFNNSRLSGYFLYYVINHLAVGASLDYSCESTNSKDVNYKTRQSQLVFNPMVRYHLPFENCLKNIYADGSFGFGFNNNKTEDDYGEDKEKASVMNWKLGAGYNYFVSEHFSLNPFVGYGGQTLNYKDNDFKTSNGGIYAGVGWNFHL